MRSTLMKKPRVTLATIQLNTKQKMAKASRDLREQPESHVGAALSKASKETGLFHT